MRFTYVIVLVLSSLICCASASASQRSITILVGAPPGGTAYALAELCRDMITSRTHRNVSIESRSGAFAADAITELNRSNPKTDYIFLGSVASLALNRAYFTEAQKLELGKFTYISGFSYIPLALIGHKEANSGGYSAFIERLRSMGRPVMFASAGVGSTMQIATELFLESHQIDGKHLPFSGSAEAISALINRAGPDIMFEPITTLIRLKSARDITIYAISDKTDLEMFRDVPLLRDAGFQNSISQYHGLVGGVDISPATASEIFLALSEATLSPEFLSRFRSLGAVPMIENGAAFEKRLFDDEQKLSSMLKKRAN